MTFNIKLSKNQNMSSVLSPDFLQKFLFHSFLSSNCFILVRGAVNVKPFPKPLNTRREYPLDELSIHHRAPCTHVGAIESSQSIYWGRRKPKNLEETHTDLGRTSEILPTDQDQTRDLPNFSLLKLNTAVLSTNLLVIHFNKHFIRLSC